MTREEAINEIKSWDFLEGKEIEAIRTLIPELKESEDERIRKALVWHLKADVDFVSNGVTKEECIAYLEKQKEQKHCWKPTETDVAFFNKAVTTNKALTPAERAQLDIIRSKFGCCRAANCSGIVQKEQKPQYIYLKFREGDIIQKITGGDIVTIAEVDTDAEEYRLTNSGFIPFKYEHLWYLIEQKPAEWSEEDERNLCRAIFYVIGYQKNNGVTNETKECKDWLEFLRLRSRWKPSKEQIDLLRKVYNLIWTDPATPADIQDGLGDFIEQLRTL